MEIKENMILHNRFDVTVVDANTNEIKQKAVGYNVVLNNFFKVRMGMDGDVGMTAGFSHISVGTGSGTPAPTDGGLFSTLTHKSCSTVEEVYQYPTSHITKQIRINADEYNGSTITEVGLSFHYVYGLWDNDAWRVVTHAMLQDSEGNQISIKKTDVDIVFITATFFCTFTPAGFGVKGIYPAAQNNVLVKWLLTGRTDYTIYMNRYAPEFSSELTSRYQFSKGYNFRSGKGNMDTLTYELPLITILDTEWNSHLVGCLGVPGIGAFQFPDESVFPEYSVDKLISGEGDGAATEFNIGCPLVKKGSIHVFVNDAELKPDEFIADYDSNCTDNRENYYTAALNTQMETVKFGDLAERPVNNSHRYMDPFSWSQYPFNKNLYASSCVISEKKPVWIDFGHPVECNSLRVDNREVNSATLDKVVIEHSPDNISWTPVNATRESKKYSGSVFYYKWKWNRVSDRYWRIYIKDSNWTYYLYYDGSLGSRDGSNASKASFFLGKNVPGIALKTPPAAGETVAASYKLDMPYKTPNNILRMTCSIKLQRG